MSYTVRLSEEQRWQIACVYVRHLLWGHSRVVVDGDGTAHFVPAERPPSLRDEQKVPLKDLPEGWQTWSEEAQRVLLREAGYEFDPPEPATFLSVREACHPEVWQQATDLLNDAVTDAVRTIASRLPSSFTVDGRHVFHSGV